MSKKSLLAGVAAVALAAVSIPAYADTIVENQWYGGYFLTAIPSALLGTTPFALGTNGPILPSPPTVGNAIASPETDGGALSAVITLSRPEWLTVTDQELSGDQFEMFVNGVAATIAPSSANGLTPGGQQSVAPGMTSVPVSGDFSCGEDISCALADANYSSGTFLLPAGTDTITGNYLGVLGGGDMSYIVTSPTPTPEPATLSLLGVGLAGLGLARRRRKRAATG